MEFCGGGLVYLGFSSSVEAVNISEVVAVNLRGTSPLSGLVSWEMQSAFTVSPLSLLLLPSIQYNHMQIAGLVDSLRPAATILPSQQGLGRGGGPETAGGCETPAAVFNFPALEGRWSLLYTTEESVRDIVGGLVLDLPVEAISQTIDLG